jgi:phage baseplate assembly protein W
MRPNFGTIIWNVLHEPFTDDLKSVIATDVKAIASYDPRVSFDNIVITEYDQGIQIELQLRYVSTNQTNLMLMNFNSQNNTLTAQ